MEFDLFNLQPQMDIIVWIGAITGLIAVYLLYKNNIWTWPVGFINIFCFLIVSWHQKLYGDFAAYILFLFGGIWGWIHWYIPSNKRPSILSIRNRIIWLLATVSTIPFTLFLLKNYTDCSYPFLEAAILNLSITGQCLSAKRKLENWYVWIVADALMVIVYSLKGIYPFALYAFIILILGFAGLFKWNKLISTQMISKL